MKELSVLGINVAINPMPVEIPNPISFENDTEHKVLMSSMYSAGGKS